MASHVADIFSSLHMEPVGFWAGWCLPGRGQSSGRMLGQSEEQWVCGFGAVLLSDSPVRPESPHKHLWVICCIIPPCSNVFYVSSDDISDVDVAVVFSPFNSQGGTLFMATLLAKEMGEK